jgi:glycosyltransferase involved in cell wall biosynthesis
MWNSNKCTLIIPTMNEAENLKLLIPQIPAFIDEVIVVDGNSTDDTVKVAESSNRVDLLVSQRRKGKGAALSRGFLNSTGDFVFMIDADGSMDPGELSIFAKALEDGAHLVKGSRYIDQGGSSDITVFRSTGNLGLTWLANTLYRRKWTDLAYGYAGFERNALTALEISYLDTKVAGPFSHRRMSYGQGFEIETLMFCRAVRRGMRVEEVPSWENERINGSSNLRAISDGTRALSALIVERIRSKRELEDI